jgi:hypothetical protein
MGHSVLQVPVPPLEPFVRERTAFHDASYVSDDPAFVHAHVTALGPFLDEVGGDDAAAVAAIAASVAPFDFVLERIDTFPNGIIHLEPEPDGPFRELTHRLWEAFPQCRPYAGQFADVRPHLTLDARTDEVTEESTRTALGGLVPARCRAERLDLAWWEPDGCRVLRSWPLGG